MGTVELKGLISIAGIVGGCFCIWLGYKLYLRNVVERGQAEGSGGGVKIILKDYGPGVVFALFGAAIIAFCVTRSFSETTVNTKTVDPTGTTVVEETSKTVTASIKARPAETPEPAKTLQVNAKPPQPGRPSPRETVEQQAQAASGSKRPTEPKLDAPVSPNPPTEWVAPSDVDQTTVAPPP